MLDSRSGRDSMRARRNGASVVRTGRAVAVIAMCLAGVCGCSPSRSNDEMVEPPVGSAEWMRRGAYGTLPREERSLLGILFGKRDSARNHQRGADSDQDGDAESEREEATGAHEMMRMRFLQRAAGRDRIPFDGLIKAKAQLDAMRARQPETQQRDGGLWTWTALGPGNIGGRIRTIAIHPTIPNRMWVGSPSGGIFRTDNGGASWAPVDDFLANLAVTSIQIDPNDTNVMYAATGEGFTSYWYADFDENYTAPPGAGVFRSDDGGVTWSLLQSTANELFAYVNRLAIDPATSDIYAAVAPAHAIWKSNNGGASWTLRLLMPGPATDVKVSPNVINRVLAASQPDDDSPGDVFYSTDYGATWVEQTTGATGKLPDDTGRCEVAFGPGDVAYVLMDRNNGQVWRSTNIGAPNPTWTLRATINVFNPSGGGSQGWYDNMIWVDPTNSNTVIIGGIDLWRSLDGGATFTKISDWRQYHTGLSAHADQHVLAPHPGYNGTTNRTVFVGNDGGIQRATDILTVAQTSGWTNLANGLAITQFYGGAASANGSVIIGGSQDNSTLRYTGGSPNSWFQAETGDGGACAIDFTNASILYAERPRLSIRKSTDGGATYATASTGILDTGSNAAFIAPFTLDPNNANVLYAGGIRIWKSTNKAASWSQSRNFLTGLPFCTALAVKPGNSNEVWAGYSDGTVSRSTNGGSTWTNVDGGSPGLPDRWVMDIAVSPYFANEAIIVFSGFESDNVWVTVNGGSTWIRRTGTEPNALPELQVNTVTYHPTNPDWIYIGTDLGVLASQDFGLNWNVAPHYPGNDGPANVEVDDLFWYQDILVAATYGRGMFRSRPLDIVYVDWANGGIEDGSAAHPYNTVREGISASGNGTTLSLRAGTYTEGTNTFDRVGPIVVTGGTVVVR